MDQINVGNNVVFVHNNLNKTVKTMPLNMALGLSESPQYNHKFKFVVKWPTRSRPELFKKQILDYIEKSSKTFPIYFLVSADDDDPTMKSADMVKFIANLNHDKSNIHVQLVIGNSTNKIEAVNADMDMLPETWEILFLASDDMVVRKNWDLIVAKDMQSYFPDSDGVLHYNDGRQGRNLNTLVIMTRKYYDRFGYIYNPKYKSVYADNEFTLMSRALNKAVYFDTVLCTHEWVNITGKDQLHLKNESPEYYQHDSQVYKEFIQSLINQLQGKTEVPFVERQSWAEINKESLGV